MGCNCTSDSARSIKCTHTLDLPSNRYMNSNQHTTGNNNHAIHSNNNINNNIYFDDMNEYQQRLLEPHLQAYNDPLFNFKALEDTYSGEGFKKMKGYICPISKEDLYKKRQFFWETRVEGNQDTWKFLRKLCEDTEFQHGNLSEYLFSSGIIPYCNCINVTYDITGSLYEIPNYCINDPVKYAILDTEKKKPIECKLTIHIRNNLNQFTITISNCSSIDKLKDEIIKIIHEAKNKSQISKHKISLFFGGKELKNDKEVWYYNVTNNVVLILMVRN